MLPAPITMLEVCIVGLDTIIENDSIVSLLTHFSSSVLDFAPLIFLNSKGGELLFEICCSYFVFGV